MSIGPIEPAFTEPSIKEIWMGREDYPEAERTPVCVIRSRNYGSSLAKFLYFAREARKDYPHLKDEDIKVVHYGGDRISGTFGIEFEPPKENLVLDGWTEIHSLELVR